MHDVTSPRSGAAEEPASPRQHLARTAVIVVVLGVLPFALDAAAAWQVLGTLVAATFVARALQVIWRAAFSTDPRHLTS
ncbi:hypothetical protein [Blastococcus sp. PRF04-17]|uniref:hypothetical protein n=1 Tax=Blastococcus sp. PRF04-17 TaxID=2933797 RepID=UPI001FF557D0|nr:hypothetical protein [Blastococcus sp. PRF04-17]UOY01686.1 hypothetical protein MVA48_22655 [Blastococcus sp. PRF04-17]